MSNLEKIIKDNLDKAEGSFHYLLCENQIFDSIKFDSLIREVYHLNKIQIPQTKRLEIAVQLWELGFLIEKLISSHYNPSDLYKISNPDDEQIRKSSNYLYFICNFFTYNKMIEEADLNIENW